MEKEEGVDLCTHNNRIEGQKAPGASAEFINNNPRPEVLTLRRLLSTYVPDAAVLADLGHLLGPAPRLLRRRSQLRVGLGSSVALTFTIRWLLSMGHLLHRRLQA